MDLRRKHPFMGKAPIQCMLERKGRRLSVSTVGRILSRVIADGRVPRASVCEGRLRPRRRRKFNGWAQRWKYGARPRRPGQLVQIDHMTFSRDGQTIKEFRAVCPASRFMVARVFSRATAFNARRFLADVVEAFPAPLQSVQVDGGSNHDPRRAPRQRAVAIQARTAHLATRGGTAAILPRRLRFVCAMRATERQIGNAVPPVLAWHIAKAIRDREK